MTTKHDPSDDRSISGKDLWTLEGTYSLIRKLENDPGLTEEFRKEAIDSVQRGAVERGIMRPNKSVESEKMTNQVKPVKSNETQETICLGKTFDSYQDFTTSTALYPADVALPYTVTGICGEAAEVAGKMQTIVSKNLIATEDLTSDEARKNSYTLNGLLKTAAEHGEVLEKFKKAVRKGELKLLPVKMLTEEEKLEIAKEVGDVLWYCAQISKSLGLPLSTIAQMNIDKLSSRKTRGVLHGSGDNR